MPESKPHGFRGWWRPNKRSPWQAVVKAASFADAWGDLLEFIANRPPSVGSERMVLEVGRQPSPPGERSSDGRKDDGC
jgi:hypothetical protein